MPRINPATPRHGAITASQASAPVHKLARPHRGAERVTAPAAWSTLTEAMRETAPACAGDDRFTADRDAVDAPALAAMAATCSRCLLSDLCHDVAAASKPSAGYWAGRHRERRTPTPKPLEPDAPGTPGPIGHHSERNES